MSLKDSAWLRGSANSPLIGGLGSVASKLRASSANTLDRTVMLDEFATTTTLGSSNNPPLLWSPVKLTASVSSPSVTPAGTVNFLEETAVVRSSPLTSGGESGE
jgi:hypothetical protein